MGNSCNRVGIFSLGCPKNLVDSQELIREFQANGFVLSNNLEHTDTTIINTCAFIEDARRESVDAILDAIELKRRGLIKRVMVVGCLTARYGKARLIRELPEVDEWRGVPTAWPRPFMPMGRRGRFAPLLLPNHYAYLKISDGCDNRCSYCVLPMIRGPYRMRPQEEILEDAHLMIQRGVKEINIIGQDTTAYPNLAGLIRQIAHLASQRKDRKLWIRLLYSHPAHFTEELVRLFKETPYLCKYIDLPLQHVNDKILKRMRRKVTKRDIVLLIERLRHQIPDLAIRTTFIVGFPGESDRRFRELLDFIREIRFEHVGAFAYSREEGTESYRASHQIARHEKEARLTELMRVQEGIVKEVLARYIGQEMDVLIDRGTHARPAPIRRGCPRGSGSGRTQFDAPEVDGAVLLKGDARVGEFVRAKITGVKGYDLAGKVVE